MIKPHTFLDNPGVEFGFTDDPVKPFFIVVRSEPEHHTLYFTDTEARYLASVGWELDRNDNKSV